MAGGPSFQSLAVLQANQSAQPLPNSTAATASPASNSAPSTQPASTGPVKKRRKRGEADGKRYPCDQCEKCEALSRRRMISEFPLARDATQLGCRAAVS